MNDTIKKTSYKIFAIRLYDQISETEEKTRHEKIEEIELLKIKKKDLKDVICFTDLKIVKI